MATIKISGLTAAAAATGTQELEVNESGTSKKITGSQLLSYIEGEISSSPTFTGQVSVADGSVSAPSITNTGDTNTGIFFPAEDTIAFAEGGSEAMRIDSSGNVGIGTSSPSSKLEILNSGDSIVTITGNTASGNFAGVDFKRNTGTVNASVRSESVGANDAGEILFQTRPISGSLTTRMRIDSSGNVGIGTSSSSVRLTLRDTSPQLDFKTSAADDISASIQGAVDVGTGGLLSFYTKRNGNTPLERMRIDSSGNVGIGTSSPGAKLDVNGAISVSGDGSDVAIYMNGSDAIRNTGTGSIMYLDVATGSSTQGQFVFRSSNAFSERMRIDSSGNVGIGTTSPGQRLEISNSSTNTTFSTVGNQLLIRNSGSTANAFARIDFSGSTNNPMASIAAQLENYGTGASSILFGNTNTGTGAIVERMRIDNTGGVGIGTSNTDPTANRVNGIYITSSGSLYSRANTSWDLGRNVTSGTNINFYTDNGSARVTAGNIASNGATTAYNTTSDYRLKENVEPVVGASQLVTQLKPVTFDWKAGFGGTKSSALGFIAHELQDVFPDAVTGDKDAVDENNNPVFQSVDQSKLVPLLTAALQEALTEISSLKARVAALETA